MHDARNHSPAAGVIFDSIVESLGPDIDMEDAGETAIRAAQALARAEFLTQSALVGQSQTG